MGVGPKVRAILLSVDVFAGGKLIPIGNEAVFHAISRRFDGERSIFMVPDALSRRLDPATRSGKYSDGIITKVGIDATMSYEKKIDQPMVEYEDIDLSQFLREEDLDKVSLMRSRGLH